MSEPVLNVYRKTGHGVYLGIVYALCVILTQSCTDSSQVDDSNDSNFELIGFNNTSVIRLVLAGSYVYACAGQHGLWRKDLGSDAGWENLGLADASLKRWYEGITDVDVYNNEILASYVGNYSDTSHPGVYRSIDNGATFARSDRGITDQGFPYSYITELARSTRNPHIVMGIHGGIYISADGGVTWWNDGAWGPPSMVIFQPPGPFEGLTFDPRNNSFWAFGYIPLAIIYLYHSSNNGISWNGDEPNTFVPRSLSFDATDSSIVYLGATNTFLKSSNYGGSWYSPVEEGNLKFAIVLAHPSIHDKLFLSDGSWIYVSQNGGRSAHRLSDEELPGITSLCLEPDKNHLFISTMQGVFRFKGMIP